MAQLRLLTVLVSIALLASMAPVSLPSVNAAAGCTTPGDAEDAVNVTTLVEDVFSEGVSDESREGSEDEESGDGEGVPEISRLGLPASPSLDSIKKGVSLRTSLDNNTANAIRLNLTTGWRYTFCVEASSLDPANGSASLDVYLLTASQFDNVYMNEESYDLDEFEELSDNGFASFFTWTPYRDVHAYENRNQTQFNVALDNDPAETSGVLSSWFSEYDPVSSSPPNFVLVIDGRDNQRKTDSIPAGVDQLVDVVILSEEQLSLPSSTVVLACCFGIIVMAAIPFTLHNRYHRAGRISESSTPIVGLVSEEDETEVQALGGE